MSHAIPRREFLTTTAALAAGGISGMAATAPDTALATPAVSGHNWQNWSGLQTVKAASLPTPATEAELQTLLARSQGEVRAVGSGHSFTALVPTGGAIISLDRMSGVVRIDKQAMTVTVKGGTRIGVLARALDAQGLGLRNQPDVDVQTIAGAISTATHGTGIGLPAMHDDVVGLRIVRPDGEVVAIDAQSHPEWLPAARVSLGSLGVISEVTLRVLPAYNLHRRVWLQPIDALLEQAPALARRHRHFELYYLPFTGYGAAIAHDVYTGQDLHFPKAADDEVLSDLRLLRDWLGRFPALRQWTASKLIDPDMKEEAKQRSWKLLSSVRPVKFNESEWHVPQSQGIACLKQIIRAIEKHNEAFFPIEFRFIKGDDAWLSPFHGRDCCSIAVHAAAEEPYQYLIDDGAPIFKAHGGRPHWGKLHRLGAKDLANLYPQWQAFQNLRQSFDPKGRMLNAHLRHLMLGA